MRITEQDFERALSDVEDNDMEQLMLELTEAQPVVAAYVFAEGFQVLTEAERAYMLFLVTSVWHTLRDTIEAALPTVTEAALGAAEEANYTLLEGVRAKTFRDKLTVFFENSAEEDLLAFIEDALTLEADDESVLTPEGQLPIFIGVKAVADCLLAA